MSVKLVANDNNSGGAVPTDVTRLALSESGELLVMDLTLVNHRNAT